jgi:Na+/H+ antiporter NhaD/arsenite permease-like protein
MLSLNPSAIQWAATICLGLAVLHSFFVDRFQRLARKYTNGSFFENLCHFLGEVETAFGLWAAIFIALFVAIRGETEALKYIESCHFTEPVFVFVVMIICSTRPILWVARTAVEAISNRAPIAEVYQAPFKIAVILILGPLLGSLLTEPAAMTITALLLLEVLSLDHLTQRPFPGLELKYAVLAVLFVNISIGGTLTPFAAPPVLMVARIWNWDLSFMLSHFAWPATIAVVLNSIFLAGIFRDQIKISKTRASARENPPLWLVLIHVLFLVAVVWNSSRLPIFVGLFLIFIGILRVTHEHQSPLKIRESLLVALFLASLVVLGGLQGWWLTELLSQLSNQAIYFGCILLTAVTDNAALTYLGAQVVGLSDAAKLSIVSGAVVGGGLTLIANAPNPVGYGILSPLFGKDGMNPLRLLLYAIPPTAIAALAFWL